MTTERQDAPAGVTTLSTPSDREIVTERVFDAPRDRVFDAYTDPELIPSWWGPRRMTTVVDAMDVKRGGAWRFHQRDSDGTEHSFGGIYREVTPPERLAMTFEWGGMPGHVIVETVTFGDLGERTRVRTTSLFHTGHERDGMLAMGMEGGVVESHDRLSGILARA